MMMIMMMIIIDNNNYDPRSMRMQWNELEAVSKSPYTVSMTTLVRPK